MHSSSLFLASASMLSCAFNAKYKMHDTAMRLVPLCAGCAHMRDTESNPKQLQAGQLINKTESETDSRAKPQPPHPANLVVADEPWTVPKHKRKNRLVLQRKTWKREMRPLQRHLRMGETQVIVAMSVVQFEPLQTAIPATV